MTAYPQKMDILASFTRANTKNATPKDIILHEHIVYCDLEKCDTEYCAEGKAKVEHFNHCEIKECFHCVLSRLFIYLDHDGDVKMGEELATLRKNLLNQIKSIKMSADKYNLLKSTIHSNFNAIRTEGDRLRNLKIGYNTLKMEYEAFCVKVYDVWKKTKN